MTPNKKDCFKPTKKRFLSWQKPDQTKESTKINRKLQQYFQRWPWKSQITCNRKTEIKSIMFCCVCSSALYFFIDTIHLLALFLTTKFRKNIIKCHLKTNYSCRSLSITYKHSALLLHEGLILRVVYICSSLLQLALESRDLSQAEKRITLN